MLGLAGLDEVRRIPLERAEVSVWLVVGHAVYKCCFGYYRCLLGYECVSRAGRRGIRSEQWLLDVGFFSALTRLGNLPVSCSLPSFLLGNSVGRFSIMPTCFSGSIATVVPSGPSHLNFAPGVAFLHLCLRYGAARLAGPWKSPHRRGSAASGLALDPDHH